MSKFPSGGIENALIAMKIGEVLEPDELPASDRCAETRIMIRTA